MPESRVLGFVGAGFASAVLARQLVEAGNFRAIIFEGRSHSAGNCHTERDAKTGILLHRYGPHIFHTFNPKVWNFVQKFGKFENYLHRVKAITARGTFLLPLNLKTLNQFYSQNFTSAQAEAFLKTQGDRSIGEPENFEEQALKFVGRELYENFFYGYTKKQWGLEPTELPASVLKRLPIRFTDDDRYFNDTFQAMPVEGYTSIVEKILDHPKIEVRLNTLWNADQTIDWDHLFFSGPLDSYFDFQLGKLEYRTLDFERLDFKSQHQSHAVVNYCDLQTAWTRISEHKHFAPWESHAESVCFREFSRSMQKNDTPYYPLRLAKDEQLLKRYAELASASVAVTFIGRLGTYRYLDMHQVIGESLDLAETCLSIPPSMWPKFSVPPL